MSEHNPDVAAVAVDAIRQAFTAGELGGMEDAVRVALAALTAAGIACVYVPEGVEVPHGSELIRDGGSETFFVLEPQ